MPFPSPTTPPPTPITINQRPLTVTQAWGSGHIRQFPVTFGDRDFNFGGSYGENTISADGQMCGDIDTNTLP